MAIKYYYQQEVYHEGLQKYKIVKAQSKYELEMKVSTIQNQWDEQWQKKVEREKAIKNEETSLKYASAQTEKAERIQSDLDNLLINSLKPLNFSFLSLKDKSKFNVKRPMEPVLQKLPIEPKEEDEEFNPRPSFFTSLSKKKLELFEKTNKMNFENAHAEWEKNVEKIERSNNAHIREHKKEVEQWEKDSQKFYDNQKKENEQFDNLENDLIKGTPNVVEKYYIMLLNNVKFPFSFEKDINAEYILDNKTLIVDMLLPNLEEIPTLKSVSYVKTKKEFKETHFTESQMKKKYDNLVYQIVLQSLNYLFTEKKEHNLLDTVVFNGKINTIDKATGKNIEPYILSVNVSKESFSELNLSAIDPRAWFKGSKGISAATFANVTPIAPIVQMNKKDSRFIEGYSVADSIDDTINLALMDWQDFENLIREIFELEFSSSGGEVKVTQASRDGGVDAVAFDPDPIRGGKIVIQAKRYTNVVGVSAVRDLYGTVMNEGANKGILVTTSNYGNDAYEFAKGKPLTLMNGANLLYLLEKHGHKAKIDLKEAKQVLTVE